MHKDFTTNNTVYDINIFNCGFKFLIKFHICGHCQAIEGGMARWSSSAVEIDQFCYRTDDIATPVEK